MERYICVHGHFYQPPRENPWLETIELQDSAYPFHDWNERITAECYAPNALSRILDSEGNIVRIQNNYSNISFDIGPTLLSWLEAKVPETYRAILEADRVSQSTFSGHGSAIAQAYNHMIMPLASSRQKFTQVHWAVKDFEHRFRRAPEGMWLPETAVDLESLEVMASLGIRFTILAPYQARRFRKIGSRAWEDATGGRVDPTTAYDLVLPSGATIVVFFYDGPVSHGVAFEGLLRNGDTFARRLLGVFSDSRPWPQLVNVATDGETYGHHHRYGDMALAYALQSILDANSSVRLTNYGEYLERHPPKHEVEIRENTSWSCAHGVERWRSDCGCKTGAPSDWHQKWRAPLREALDWLDGTVWPRYTEESERYLKDSWVALNDYIEVILERSPARVRKFFERHAARPLNRDERTRVLKLMELQRHAMLMYTSCGWFFSDISGQETVQVLQYAGRAIQLSKDALGMELESEFVEMLEKAPSNVVEYRNGKRIYEQFVMPAVVDLQKVGAHFALSSLFEDYGRQTDIFCYQVNCADYRTYRAGKSRLAIGRARVTSKITLRKAELCFAALHFTDHNAWGGVQPYLNEETYDTMAEQISEAFNRADFAQVIRLMDRTFKEHSYSLKSLFKDEQRKIAIQILKTTLQEAEAAYREIYEPNLPLMRFVEDLGVPLPRAFDLAAQFVLDTDLHRAFEADELDLQKIALLLRQARQRRVTLDAAGLGFAVRRAMQRLGADFKSVPTETSRIKMLEAFVDLVKSLPFPVALWDLQNVYYELMHSLLPEMRERAETGDKAAREWFDQFTSLGKKLSVRVHGAVVAIPHQ
jgi:alpha-amylase/alpha-mannosidase (GH57 family)